MTQETRSNRALLGRGKWGRRALLLALCTFTWGCSSGVSGGAVAPSGGKSPQELLQAGKRYAQEGQSVRAEQYFLAATEAGGDPAEAFELILETCIQSGRLGSALGHVQHRLRRHPDDVRLMTLAAALNEGLGHARAALVQVSKMDERADLGPDEQLFVAEFFHRTGHNTERAVWHYEKYLERKPRAEQKPWVQTALGDLLAEMAQTTPVFEASEPNPHLESETL